MNLQYVGMNNQMLMQECEQSTSMFPKIANLGQFKHHLHITLMKFAEMNMISKAHEEMRDLMSEHITNTDRMNALLSSLANDTKYNLNKNQRKEIIKLFGVAAEIFEESLITFVPKLVLLFQKLLKECLDYLHHSIAWSLGKVIFFITSKIQSIEEGSHQTNQVLKQLYTNFYIPNHTLQVGAAVSIDQVIQNSNLPIL